MFGVPSVFDLSADGQRLLTMLDGESPDVVLWDVRSGTQVLRLRGAARAAVDEVRFSPDGSRLAVVSNASVAVWDATRLTHRLQEARPMLAAIAASATDSPGTTPRASRQAAAIVTQRVRSELLAATEEVEGAMPEVCGGTAKPAQLEHCLTTLRRAHAEAPDARRMQFLLGLVSYHTGAYEEAIRLLTACTQGHEDPLSELAPPGPVHGSYLAMAHAKSGRVDDARRALAEVHGFDLDDLAHAEFGLTGRALLRRAETVFAECFPDAALPQAPPRTPSPTKAPPTGR